MRNKTPKSHYSYEIQEIPELLEKYLRTTEFDTIADINSSHGSVLNQLKDKGYLDNKDIYLLDTNSEKVSIDTLLKSSNLLVDDYCNINYVQTKSIDIVICNQVIEHLDYDKELIKQIYDILSPNGILYLSTIYRTSNFFSSPQNISENKFHPEHKHEYRQEEELLKPIKDQGFQILENRKIPFHVFPINNLLSKIAGQNSKVTKFFNNFSKVIKVNSMDLSNWEIVGRKLE
ncbi:methyltransferase domain-containing protein [Candidatus Dojkabacteria bacterium]|nr:methyltransferase domain-containing protein [Candidatus Dojkabacteria bacterium]